MERKWWIGGLLALTLALGACGDNGGSTEEDIIWGFDNQVADEQGQPDVVAPDVPADEQAPEEVGGDVPVVGCDPNPCTEPPAAACDADGVTLWTYAPDGTCTETEEGVSCDYEQVPLNCAELQSVCIDGECVEVEIDPCDPNPCTVAPEPLCSEDGTTLTEYEAPGTCTDNDGEPLCEYASTDTVCTEQDQICKNGACVDPCDPNPCTEPPATGCAEDGITLLEYPETGECTVDGLTPICDYAAIETDCSEEGMVCTEGACVYEGTGNQPDVAGEVLFTEFMAKSQAGSDKGEWVELYNASDESLDLGGCLFKDAGSDSHEIVGPLVFAPGAYLLLARSDVPEENHGLEPDYVYGGNSLSNSDDELIIECNGLVIDEVIYNGNLVLEGVAAQLDLDSFDVALNDDGANWCPAMQTYGTAGKLGTPGLANEACPEPDPCDPNPCTEAPADLCAEDGLTLNTFSAPGNCTNVDGEAVCDYPPVPVDCSADQKICKDGACVEPPADPCDPNPCTEPPAPVCEVDGVTLTTHVTPGACTNVDGLASCEYTPETTDCGQDGGSCLDGACVPAGTGNTPDAAGEILITEHMPRSQSGTDNGEWVEVHNPGAEALDLGGCLLKDDNADSHEIAGTLVIPAGGYLVLAKSADPVANHGLQLDYVYSGFNLSNSGDAIIVECGGLVIDQVGYPDTAVILGAALQLDPDSYDAGLNDDPGVWCAATQVYGTADKLGTPGAANEQCPEPDPCDPNPCTEPPVDLCDMEGKLLTKYDATGTCTNVEGQASCEYNSVVIDCTLEEGVCLDGQCVTPCNPNPCTEPPVDTCDEAGLILTKYPAEGVCTLGEGQVTCDYPAETVDCGALNQECVDGECVDPGAPPQPDTAGDFVLTEFMPRSQSGTDKGEWVEFVNNTDTPLNVGGCFLKDDDGESVEITVTLAVNPGDFVLFARSDVPVENHGLPAIDFVYGGSFQLANSADEIALVCNDVVIDHVAYVDTWVILNTAIQLDPGSFDAGANDLLENWCAATTEFGTAAKLGTPGAANVACVSE